MCEDISRPKKRRLNNKLHETLCMSMTLTKMTRNQLFISRNDKNLQKLVAQNEESNIEKTENRRLKLALEVAKQDFHQTKKDLDVERTKFFL